MFSLAEGGDWLGWRVRGLGCPGSHPPKSYLKFLEPDWGPATPNVSNGRSNALESNSMSEIILTLSRVRRAMPRNLDVMAVCDELERLMRSAAVPSLPKGGGKFDKTGYQREYMKLYRARKKNAGR